MVAKRTMIAAARHHGEGAADILFQTLILCCALQPTRVSGLHSCRSLQFATAQHETLVEKRSAYSRTATLLWRFAPGTPPPEKVHSFVDQLADCASILRSDIL
jgi:hypothetical protein